MATLAELIATRGTSTILADMIAQLQIGEFPTTDWTDGGPERTLLEAEAAAQVDLWEVAKFIASGAHPDLATGDWLTLLAYYRYQLDRIAATATVGNLTLTCSAAAGPYTIVAGQLQFQGSATGNYYRNTTGGVLNPAGTLDITIEAEAVGADEGSDTAGTINRMTTPLAGVESSNDADVFGAVTQTGTGLGVVTPDQTSGVITSNVFLVEITTAGTLGTAVFRISKNYGAGFYASGITVPGGGHYGPDAENVEIDFSNPSGVPTPFVLGDLYRFDSPGTWYTSQGTDEESDASLVQRCKARWPSLSLVPTDDVYTAMAKVASPYVVKVKPTVDLVVPAQVNIVIAGAGGTVTFGIATVVQDYIDARAPLTDVPVVASAGTMPISLAGATVTVKAANLAAAQASASANVLAYINGLDIGDGSTVLVVYSQIIEAILRDSGDERDSVNGLTVNGGAVDLAVTDGDVATWNEDITSVLTWAVY